jgi:hypothetical protein
VEEQSIPLKTLIPINLWLASAVGISLASGTIELESRASLLLMSALPITAGIAVVWFILLTLYRKLKIRNYTHTYLIEIALIAAILTNAATATFFILTSPVGSWDFLDYWGPRAVEVITGTTRSAGLHFHQPNLMPENLAFWQRYSNDLLSLHYSSGSQFFWLTLLILIYLLSYLLPRLLGISTAKSLFVVLCVVNVPLFENHLALVGYTETLTIVFLFSMLASIMAYRNTGGLIFLWMALSSALGAAMSRNTGIFYVAIFSLPALLIYRPTRYLLMGALPVCLSVCVALLLSAERVAPDVFQRGDAIFGEVDCPPEAAEKLYLRLIGDGDAIHPAYREPYTDMWVESTSLSARKRFFIDLNEAQLKNIWSLRVRCMVRDSGRWRPVSSENYPVASHKLEIREGLTLYKVDNGYVFVVNGRLFRIAYSADAFLLSLAQQLLINQSFSVFLLLNFIGGCFLLRRRHVVAHSPVCRWWVRYTLLLYVISNLFYFTAYLCLPYLRDNAAPGSDTLGSRALMPIVMGVSIATLSAVFCILEQRIVRISQATPAFKT